MQLDRTGAPPLSPTTAGWASPSLTALSMVQARVYSHMSMLARMVSRISFVPNGRGRSVLAPPGASQLCHHETSIASLGFGPNAASGPQRPRHDAQRPMRDRPCHRPCDPHRVTRMPPACASGLCMCRSALHTKGGGWRAAIGRRQLLCLRGELS